MATAAIAAQLGGRPPQGACNDRPTPPPVVLSDHEAWATLLNRLASYRLPPNCQLRISPDLPTFNHEAASSLNNTKIPIWKYWLAPRNSITDVHLAAVSCRQSGSATLCPPAGVWTMVPNTQPVHLLTETLAALFTATFSARFIHDSWATSAVTSYYTHLQERRLRRHGQLPAGGSGYSYR